MNLRKQKKKAKNMIAKRHICSIAWMYGKDKSKRIAKNHVKSLYNSTVSNVMPEGTYKPDDNYERWCKRVGINIDGFLNKL